MNDSLATIPVLQSVSTLAKAYDVWLCDIWGVMHNGEAPFAAAGDACFRFREQGGTVILVSNSPRPYGAVSRQMAEIGVPEASFDAVVTSGDTTRQVLLQRKDQSVFHLGPARDAPLLQGLDVKLEDMENADYVLCTGLYDDLTETPENYAAMLARMRERNLQMVCANPDIQVERGNRLLYCAGALAAAYAELGGEVIYTGKPHAPIYDRACELVNEARGQETARTRILCIGDGIKTDMAGASAAGMDALFISSGLHIDRLSADTPLTQKMLETAFSGTRMRPVAAQAGLKW